MNEKEIIEIIKTHASKELLQEVLDHNEMSQDWEEPYALAESFDYIADLAESEGSWKHLKTPARKVQIALGEYVAMTEDEIENTWRSDGKKWDFKLGGIAYSFSHHVASPQS